jgi:hypothetical protein
MIGTKSLIDCLRSSFERIKSRRNSKVRPIHKVIEMIKTESLLDCLCTSFGRIRSKRSAKGFDLSKGHADDWDRVFDGLPTYLFWEDQVQT